MASNNIAAAADNNNKNLGWRSSIEKYIRKILYNNK